MDTSHFHTLGLEGPILQTLARQRFETPTPVQGETIPLVLAGNDVLATAQTGSGKTAAFGLPILYRFSKERHRMAPGRPRALVLAPTRELVAQIGEVLRLFGSNLRVSSTVIFGGVGKGPQVSALRRGVDIVVATPGRLLDLMGEGAVRLDAVKVAVLDEADRMLDMGFLPDVKRIVSHLPDTRQSLFFSATMPPEVAQLAGDMLKSPRQVRIAATPENDPRIDQHVMFVSRENKREALRMLLRERNMFRALVFTKTKYRARDLSRYLGKNGIKCDDLQGNKSQNARTRALSDFQSGRIQVLVATDIASRGIDVVDIDHVINFEMPIEPASYVHRIGRTARAGKAGTALSLCSADELRSLGAIQKVLRYVIPVIADHPFHAADVASAASRRVEGGGGNGRAAGRGEAESYGHSGRSRGGHRPGAAGHPARKNLPDGGTRDTSARGGKQVVRGRHGAKGEQERSTSHHDGAQRTPRNRRGGGAGRNGRRYRPDDRRTPRNR